MAKYLKKFENHTAYETAESGLILPNVSICVTEGDVHYNPYNPPIIDGHEYVDLGLPSGTLWARMNVGATSETDYGNHYQYGKGTNDVYITSGETDYIGTENPLAASADTAVQAWGGSWHMPSSAQCQELLDNTTGEWTNINGVNGKKFTAQNGNYIFFPAAGLWFDGTWRAIGTDSDIWTSTSRTTSQAYSLAGLNEYTSYITYAQRRSGRSIRPVVG